MVDLLILFEGIMLPSKWENLSRCTKLIHVYKKLPVAMDCGQSKYSQ